MSFTTVGSIIQTSTSTLSLSPQTIGDLIVLEVITDSTAPCTNVSGGGCSWTPVGATVAGSVNTGNEAAIFIGTVTATGSASATLSFNGSPSIIRAAGQEFRSSVGTWTLDQQSTLDNSGTSALPALTPVGSGELYFGYFFDSNAVAAGSTAGYTYNSDIHNNGVIFNQSCSSARQSPAMGDSTNTFGLAVIIQTPTVGNTAYLVFP